MLKKRPPMVLICVVKMASLGLTYVLMLMSILPVLARLYTFSTALILIPMKLANTSLQAHTRE
jgi:hypothetical protein